MPTWVGLLCILVDLLPRMVRAAAPAADRVAWVGEDVEDHLGPTLLPLTATLQL